MIKSRRRCDQCITRRESTVLVQEPESRPFGRIIHKREDYFKLVLGATEFEGMNWVYQPQGRVQWQVIKNHQVS